MAVFLSPVGGAAAQFFTNAGVILSGGKLYSYAAGTTTPATTYTTNAGTVARTNPIILDSAGRVPSGGEIWLTTSATYKFLLKDSNDVLIGTYDNINSIVGDYIFTTPNGGAITLSPTNTAVNKTITIPATTGTMAVINPTTGISGIGQLNGVTSINGGQLAGLRNRVINGGMQIAQRATVTLTGVAQYGQTDRMQVWCSSGTSISGTIAQGTSSGFISGYYAGASAASWTTGQFIFQQKIEALNVQDLNSKTVTVSCNVYQDTGGTRNFVIGLVKPSAPNDWTSNSLIGGSYSSAKAATTGVVTTISASFILGATDATNGVMVQIVDSTANTIVNKNYFVGDLQLEISPVATTFEQRPYGMELALCQYYGRPFSAKVGAYATAAGQTFGLTTTFPSMRIAPAFGTNTFSNANTGATSVDNITTYSARLYAVSSAAGNLECGYTGFLSSEL